LGPLDKLIGLEVKPGNSFNPLLTISYSKYGPWTGSAGSGLKKGRCSAQSRPTELETALFNVLITVSKALVRRAGLAEARSHRTDCHLPGPCPMVDQFSVGQVTTFSEQKYKTPGFV
jgi:hypothetical protein